MATFDEKIARLSDQQALSIVDSLSGEFAPDELPEGKEAQVRVLEAFLRQEGQSVDVARAVSGDTAAGAAARELLRMMAQVAEIRPSLDEWLDNPPKQEAMAVPLLLGAPAVLTGCVVLLQVAGHIRVKRRADGSWEIEYDPVVASPLDKIMANLAETLARVMRSLRP